MDVALAASPPKPAPRTEDAGPPRPQPAEVEMESEIEPPLPSGDYDALAAYLDYEKDVMHHAISVADSKAGFALAISLTLAGIEFPPALEAIRAGGAPIRILTLFITQGLLLTSVGAAFLTILPRLVRHESEGLIFWGSKNFARSQADYIADCRRIVSEAQLQHEQLAHLHTLAQISRSKYKHLTIALWLIPFGLAALFLSRAIAA